jgi:hypothetical protein
MKATRQLTSLCLVIGMTIISFTFSFAPPKEVPHLIHSAISKSQFKRISPQFVTGVGQQVTPVITG